MDAVIVPLLYSLFIATESPFFALFFRWVLGASSEDIFWDDRPEYRFLYTDAEKERKRIEKTRTFATTSKVLAPSFTHFALLSTTLCPHALSSRDVATPAGLTTTNLIQEVNARAEQLPEKYALAFQRHGDCFESWTFYNYTQYKAMIYSAARALVHLGLEPGKGIAILAWNCPQ